MKNISLIILFFLCQLCLGQEYSDLVPYRKDTLWGYSDKQKNIVVPCIYQETRPFVGNFGIVKKEEKFGAINPKGNVVVPIDYDEAFCISEHFIKVKKNGHYGVVSKYGLILKPIYIGSDFSDPFLQARRLKNGESYFDLDRIHILDSVLLIHNKGKYLLKDDKGKKIKKFCKDCLVIGQSEYVPLQSLDQLESFGLIIYKHRFNYGVIDYQGNEIIPMKYNQIHFLKNIIIAEVNDSLAIYNKNGELILNQQPGELLGGLFTFNSNKNYTGNVSQKLYPNVDWLEDGYFLLTRIQARNSETLSEDKIGLINCNGDVILPNEYNKIDPFFSGVAAVVKDNKLMYIDTEGNALDKKIDKYPRYGWRYEKYLPRYDDGPNSEQFYNDLYRNYWKVGYPEYYIIEKNGKYGIIDRKRNNVIPFEYELITDVDGNLFKVWITEEGTKKTGYINIEGDKYFEN